MRKDILALTLLLGSTTAFAQEQRPSSSMYLPAWQKADVSIPFSITAEGKRFEPTWGVDLAWISEQNVMKGVNHMLKENVGIGRSAFRYTKELTNDSALASADLQYLRQRNTIFNKISTTLPIVLTADQEAVSPNEERGVTGPPEYFVKNKVANNDHWAAMINSHVHWLQQNTKHPVVGISPFNEGDFWTTEEGATPTKQYQVAKLLKENYPRCADIAMVGGNTLNDDKALAWYTPGKQYYDWGNTHQLAGSFDNFAKFYQQVAKDGKVGYADEMHNVAEAMVGLEYGMTVGIWWGFDSRARGEFCQISRTGTRLAYGEHRNNWTAASVWRHDDGRVKAFIGSSERQAVTTSYQLVSTERDVYYDGYGPVREYLTTMPGGTGYQTGQTNAERVIDVTWGEDVQPSVIDGVYHIVNKKTGNCLGYSSNGTNIVQQKHNANNKRQQWTIRPATKRTGGDLSFYDIESVNNANIRINVKDYSLTTADLIAWTQDKPTSNEQWYLEYAGDGYYYLRNRESALYMASASNTATANVIQTKMLAESLRDRMLFRLLPLEVTYETTAPAQPQGLMAGAQQAAVHLSWTANNEEDLAGYIVLRANKADGQWNTIARKLNTTKFVDNTCRPGVTYIYKVKAIDLADNLSEASETAEATPTGEKGLVAHWNFEGNLYDDTPNWMDAAGSASMAYGQGRGDDSQAVLLTTGTKYLQLPYEVAASNELTITMWVKWGTSSNWQRIFDFGNDTEHYMFLTPANSYTNVMRFAIKNGGDEQTLDCKQKLTLSTWKHVAVVIGKDKTAIYIDGVEAASSTGITIRPSDIHPVLNYIGRSQFTADPYFRGAIDDLRIYNYALSADEVSATMNALPLGIQQVQATDAAGMQKTYGIDGRQYDESRQKLQIVNGRKVLKK
jgi:hypothetical protein